jgi:ketosteroid isomerase-like protein
MKIRERSCRTQRSSGLAVAALTLLMTAVLAACGGSSSGASSATTGGGISASPLATPPAAAPERFMGSDSVAVTQKMVDDARAALHAPTAAKLAAWYTHDSIIDDVGIKMRFRGRADALKAFRQNMREYSGATWTAGYAGRGSTVIEERWDFTKTYGGTIQFFAVAKTHGGKVVHEYDSYQYIDNLPNGTPLEPKPLKSAPGPADTPEAAEAVALKYAAALQAKDAAVLAALSGPTIDFTDTASSDIGGSPDQVQTRYTKIFSAPTDLAFTHVKYAFGAGWAAVLWTASSKAPDISGGGATVLEIRDGKIARQTLYYNSSNMPF